ncbi:cyclin-dependent kinase 2-interacting protein-like [Ostrinia nubilalis]|uniref:cyclin-dependent kinase 2-interacting protein-like n=1 Tax=Ostrinia furnacalis TaxID=93504 RepID=UPI0010406DC7|nr:cyclin-dependent kinase 2-interacting protein-like [Ostrinia furnacalis]
MSKTPPNNVDAAQNFTPRELPTPNKDTPGISKTVFTHVSTLHGLLIDWNRFREKGVKLCRAIYALKLYECADDYYPSQLKPLMDNLVEALNGLKDVVEGAEVVNKQLEALANLQPSDEPIILTWTAKKISETVNKIFTSMQKEFKVKQIITENIAHCRDEKMIDVYISSWELEPFFEPNAYLFAEVGLPGIT